MGKLVLPYQLHQGANGFDLLPLCTVVLLGRRRISVPAVVDSGATHPFFPAIVAEDAGVDLTRARPFNAVFGGSREVGKLAECFIELGGQRLRTEIVFVKEIQLGYALLGRRGVFAKFNEVAFLDRSETSRVELRW